MRTRHLAVTLLLVLGGCSLLPFHHHQPGGAGPQEQVPDATLRVDNHNWSQMVVFGVSGGLRVRLGDVNTGSELVVTIPRNLVQAGTLTILLHPIGGPRDYSTGPILVSAGQELTLRVENNLNQTSWSVEGP